MDQVDGSPGPARLLTLPPAEGGGPRYRVRISPLFGGGALVVALPLRDTAATLHRVTVPPHELCLEVPPAKPATPGQKTEVPGAPQGLGSRRQTIVFFHDPRADALIECIPGCADAEHPPRYEPVTALEHVQAKAAKAQKA